MVIMDIIFYFFVCGASANAILQTHFVSFCSDFGMTAVASASVMATMGVAICLEQSDWVVNQ